MNLPFGYKLVRWTKKNKEPLDSTTISRYATHLEPVIRYIQVDADMLKTELRKCSLRTEVIQFDEFTGAAYGMNVNGIIFDASTYRFDYLSQVVGYVSKYKAVMIYAPTYGKYPALVHSCHPIEDIYYIRIYEARNT